MYWHSRCMRNIYVMYLTATMYVRDVVGRPGKVSQLAPPNDASDQVPLRFDKETSPKLAGLRPLLVLVDMLIRCWIISHATGSRYVVRTFAGGLRFEVRYTRLRFGEPASPQIRYQTFCRCWAPKSLGPVKQYICQIITVLCF